jgi:hypothetical protein
MGVFGSHVCCGFKPSRCGGEVHSHEHTQFGHKEGSKWAPYHHNVCNEFNHMRSIKHEITCRLAASKEMFGKTKDSNSREASSELQC